MGQSVAEEQSKLQMRSKARKRYAKLKKKKKKSKKSNKGAMQQRERQGKTQLATRFPVIVDGDLEKYRQVITVMKCYRWLFRQFDSIAGMGESIASDFGIHEVEMKGKNGKKVEDENGDVKMREVLGVNIDYDRSRQIMAGALGTQPGKKPYYELRPFFVKKNAEWAEQGVAHFGTHIFDSMISQLHAVRNKREPDYFGIPRGILVAMGERDQLPARWIGIPFIRWHASKPDKNGEMNKRITAWFIKDGEGKKQRLIIRLQWGNKGEHADFVVHGQSGGSKHRIKAASSQRYVFHKLYTGEWDYQTPVLFMRKNGSMFVNVPFSRPARREKDLDRSRVAEIVFHRMDGHDLPRKKKETVKDDDKIYAIHVLSGKGITRKVFRVPVNDVIADLVRLSSIAHQREVRRDCRRYWPKRLIRPLKEQVSRVTRARETLVRQANHAWSARIIAMITSWRIGKIKIFGPPDGSVHGLLGDGTYSWGWHDFVDKLKYKARDRGIIVEQTSSEKLIDKMVKVLNEVMDEHEVDDANEEATSASSDSESRSNVPVVATS